MIKYLLFNFLLISPKIVLGQSDSTYFKEIIGVLANDSLQGRAVSSVYEEKSAKYISKKFKENKKFKPQIHHFQYFNADSSQSFTSKNVYCFLDNKADSTILIGAHYDHIGLGNGFSRSYNQKGVHNGADDNASGVALMLGLAKTHKKWVKKKYNYLFVAYSAHEIGLFGSTAFSKFCETNFKPIHFVLNFDMVGRFDEKAQILNIYGVQTLKKHKNYFDLLDFKGKIYTQESDIIFQTDAKSFAQKNIQSLSFTTGIHIDYHKVSDDENKINYKGLLYIQQIIQKFLLDM